MVEKADCFIPVMRLAEKTICEITSNLLSGMCSSSCRLIVGCHHLHPSSPFITIIIQPKALVTLFAMPHREKGLVDLHCVQTKNTHSHFLLYTREWWVDLNKNCSEYQYTHGKVDYDNIEIRYLLRPMTYLWRHICLAKVGASLHHAISHEPRISFLACSEYLLVHRRGHIVYFVVEFKSI